MVCGALTYSFIYFPFSCTFNIVMQDAEKLRGLTIDMHALMEYHYAEVVCTDSMVCRKRRRLNFFQQWLSNFFDGGKLQTGQTSLFPILSTDAFRKMPDVKFLQLNYTNFHGIFENFPKNLIWLCWHGLSWSSIPNHVCLEKLVVLDLSRSCLVDAWKGKPVCIKSLYSYLSRFQLITTKFMYFHSFFQN